LGIGKEIPVVVYDTKDNKWAARGAFILEAYGHPDV
jgi:3-mercaptopyruvate sulfurtransferase SseA